MDGQDMVPVPSTGQRPQPLCLWDRPGSIETEWCAFLRTNSKLKCVPLVCWSPGFGSLFSPPGAHPKENKSQLLTVKHNWCYPALELPAEDKSLKRRQEDGQPFRFPEGQSRGGGRLASWQGHQLCSSAATPAANRSQIPSAVKRALCYC